MAPVAKLLGEKGLELSFVCKDQQNTDFYTKEGFESLNICDEIFDNKKIVTEKEKEELDLKYGPPGIREICDSDVHLASLFGSDHGDKENVVYKAIKFWEKYFDKKKIDYLVSIETASVPPRSAYLVAKKRGIPIMFIASGPDNQRFCMNDIGETYAWKELVSSLDDKNKFISDEDKKEALDFIGKRIQRTNKMPIFFAPESLFKSIKNLIGLWVRDNKKNRQKDPIAVASMNFGRGQLWKRMKWFYFTRYFFRYDEFKKDEKYVYFPFFSAKETYYLSNDMYYGENEISLLKETARCLPSGYFLYTKEHPFNPGDFTFSELKKLKESSNIKVFHPSISSQELLDNSAAVVTVEGTVGWESLLCKKPLVCIGGMPYYAYSTLVYKVSNICNLSSVLYEAIKNGPKIYNNKEEEWYWFINKVVSTCNFGAIYEPGSPIIMKNDENIRNIANSLADKIKKDLRE